MILLLGDLALIFAAGMGYFYWQTQQLKQYPAPTIQHPQPKPPTQSPDLTANWKTYLNNDYNFSLKYPPEAEFNTTPSTKDNPSTFEVWYMGEKQKASGRIQTELADGYIFKVSIRNGTKEADLESLSGETYNYAKIACEGLNSTFSPITQISIAGKPARSYKVTNCLGDYTENFVLGDKNVFMITQIYTGEPADEAKYRETTQKILSTFKSTN